MQLCVLVGRPKRQVCVSPNIGLIAVRSGGVRLPFLKFDCIDYLQLREKQQVRLFYGIHRVNKGSGEANGDPARRTGDATTSNRGEKHVLTYGRFYSPRAASQQSCNPKLFLGTLVQPCTLLRFLTTLLRSAYTRRSTAHTACAVQVTAVLSPGRAGCFPMRVECRTLVCDSCAG